MSEKKIEDYANELAGKKYPKHNSVVSLNKFISYKKGILDGIELMRNWATFYEENKFKLYTTNPQTQDELLNSFLEDSTKLQSTQS